MTKTKHGFTLKIFVPDEDPDGLKIVEKSNWTGQGIVFPRSLFGEVKQRKELSQAGAGVYVLWGPGETGGLPTVYVGEGDPPLPRLEQHMQKKDFWTRAVVFVGKLNKAHVQHLESRLYELAEDAKRCELDNGNKPQPPTLSEADQAEAESFLENVLLCLPLLGVDVFEKGSTQAQMPKSIALFIKAKKIEARGAESSKGFLVYKGSEALKPEAKSIHSYLSDTRKTLLEKGVFKEKDGKYILTQDYVFSSPSTAAGVILGRSANGRTEWQDASGRTLKAIQEAEAEGGK